MTDKPTYEELKAVFDSLPTADAKLAWTETLPEDSSFFTSEPRNPEFAELERQLSLSGGPRGLRALPPTTIDRLSPSEVESLRSEMQRSSDWMRQELQKT